MNPSIENFGLSFGTQTVMIAGFSFFLNYYCYYFFLKVTIKKLKSLFFHDFFLSFLSVRIRGMHTNHRLS